MNISHENIKAFIAYLYKNKTGNEAPENLLASWENLNDEQIGQHLVQMTEKWDWDDDKLQAEITNFLQNTASSESNKGEKVKPEKNLNLDRDLYANKSDVNDDYVYVGHDKFVEKEKAYKKRLGLKISLGVVVLGIIVGLYIYSKYEAYKNLPFLYANTDSIVIRDKDGNDTGKRMGITNADSMNIFSELRQVDDQIYKIPIGNKISESRKLWLPDAIFTDYLFGRDNKAVYVSMNYLTDNDSYVNNQQNVFSELHNYINEMRELDGKERETIVKSIMHSNYSDLHLVISCNNINNTFSSLYIQHLAGGALNIIGRLSDGNYYIFQKNAAGDISPSIPLQFQDETGSRSNFGGEYLFKKGDNRLYNCNRQRTDYQLVKDKNGMASHIEQYVEPYVEENSDNGGWFNNMFH